VAEDALDHIGLVDDRDDLHLVAATAADEADRNFG
jgi:hypothetical protein